MSDNNYETKKTIAVDATPFMFPGAGVGRAIETLLNTIASLNPPFEFILYARRFKGKALSKGAYAKRICRYRFPKFLEPVMKATSFIEHFVKADLYHATDHYMPLGHPENAILTIHDMMFMNKVESNWGIHDYLAKNVPAFARKCRHIITCSEYTKSDIIKFTGVDPGKITVIPWGIDHNLFSPAQNDISSAHNIKRMLGIDYPYFLSVACSTGRKNTLSLIRAWAKIARKFPAYKFVAVWAPPREVIKLCHELGVHDSIIFTGRVDDHLLRDLYRSGEFLVYPSLYEGFGLPVLEAMSCGMPVITSNVTSIPEVGGELAIYIDPKKEDEISSAIEDFIYNKRNTPELRRKCTERASFFNWNTCAEKTLEIYSRFI